MEQSLSKKSLKELKTLHKTLTTYTKKKSSKKQIIESVNNLFQTFDNDVNKTDKKHIKTDIDKMSAIDLRQAHQKFRQCLQLKKVNKVTLVQSLIKLCKEIDFFIQY